ncbi:MAG: hypothetical protein ACXWLH_04295 [Candidatus Saccharimonadales bacterium]
MIKRLVIISILVFGLLGVSTVTSSSRAFATDLIDPGTTTCAGSAAKSAPCTGGSVTNPLLGPNGFLSKITNIIAYIAGAAAVIVILVSGVRFITSGGDSGKVATARNGIIYALIGIVVIVSARIIIIYVVTQAAK